MQPTAQQLQAEIAAIQPKLAQVQSSLSSAIVGQSHMLQGLLVALLADGHVLLEGVPGLAKTTAVRALASAMHLKFVRIQFTPDLLPSDLVGTQVYDPATHGFRTERGPLFANMVLADEINRAPAKVQSALLEVMQEHQITLAGQTHKLEEPFMVLATQNPIEQEGTYPLPEAQVDRFLLKLVIKYPTRDEELRILRLNESGQPQLAPTLNAEDILKVRTIVNRIYIDDRVAAYIVDLVRATREPEAFGLKDLKAMIEFGASPRASIGLMAAARALAVLNGRAFVTPQDIKDLARDVLRHRILVSYEAEAENVTSDDIVARLLTHVQVP